MISQRSLKDVLRSLGGKLRVKIELVGRLNLCTLSYQQKMLLVESFNSRSFVLPSQRIDFFVIRYFRPNTSFLINIKSCKNYIENIKTINDDTNISLYQTLHR